MINGDLCHELLLEKTKQKLAFDKKADYEGWNGKPDLDSFELQ